MDDLWKVRLGLDTLYSFSKFTAARTTKYKRTCDCKVRIHKRLGPGLKLGPD